MRNYLSELLDTVASNIKKTGVAHIGQSPLPKGRGL